MFRRLTNPTLSWLAALALTGMALLVRLPGFDGRPLFIDELWRALLILDPGFLASYLAPTVESALTSPIYALLIKAAAIFAISPDSLRLPSLLCGLLACALGFALTRKAGGSVALGFLAGLFFALNGNFITYSNQMKPYIFEVCIHLICVYAWLATIAAPRPGARDWVFCVVTLTLAIFSTPTSVFLLPAFGLSLFMQFLTTSDRKNLGVCILTFAGLGILVLALYIFSWRYGATGDMLTQWAAGFAAPGQSYPAFLGSHFLAMWQASFQIVVAEPPLAVLGLALLVGSILWAVVNGSIARALFRNILLFYAVLIVTLCLVNALHIWPLGALRPNLFLYAHMLAFLFLALAQVRVSPLLLRISAAAGLIAFLAGASAYAGKLNVAGLEKRLHNDSAPIEPSEQVVRDFSTGGAVGKSILAECPSRKTVLVVEGTMGMAIRYYTSLDTAHRQAAALLTGPCVSLVVSPEAYADPKAAADAFSHVLAGAPGAWFLYTHYDDSALAALKRVAAGFGKIRNAHAFGLPGSTGGAGYFEVTPQ